MRNRIAIVHRIAGMTAFMIMLAFMAGSVVSELSGDTATIAATKDAIRWGLLALVPALAATGGSGFNLVAGKPKGPAMVKFARMRIVAANGILILVPSVLYLAWKAEHGEFDGWFVAVQTIEYLAGSANLVLMGLNIREGMRLSGRLRGRTATRTAR
jgi:hypothetical protein